MQHSMFCTMNSFEQINDVCFELCVI